MPRFHFDSFGPAFCREDNSSATLAVAVTSCETHYVVQDVEESHAWLGNLFFARTTRFHSVLSPSKSKELRQCADRLSHLSPFELRSFPVQKAQGRVECWIGVKATSSTPPCQLHTQSTSSPHQHLITHYRTIQSPPAVPYNPIFHISP